MDAFDCPTSENAAARGHAEPADGHPFAVAALFANAPREAEGRTPQGLRWLYRPCLGTSASELESRAGFLSVCWHLQRHRVYLCPLNLRPRSVPGRGNGPFRRGGIFYRTPRVDWGIARLVAAAGSVACGWRGGGFRARAPISRPEPSGWWIFCCGGVSHIDTFDFKPCWRAGTEDVGREGENLFLVSLLVMKSPAEFRQHGRSGAWVSSLLPRLAVVDDLASSI